MLIRFSVENFLSYKDRQTLDMTAVKTCKDYDDDNTFISDSYRLLKSSAIYGANASGKSNLFVALKKMTDLVVNSSKESQAEEEIDLIPFMLNPKTKNAPSKFEIEFIYKETQYRYGFEADKKEIKSEWLFSTSKNKKENPLFLRINQNDEDEIQIFENMEKAKGLEERTRANALFLSVCAQFAVDTAEKIVKWFSSQCKVIFGSNTVKYREYTISKILSGEDKDAIITFMRDADLNIQDFRIEQHELSDENIPDELKDFFRKMSTKNKKENQINRVKSLHNVYDDSNNVVGTTELDFDRLESAGTIKAFELSGQVVDTLKNGSVLFIDELDSKLHPIFTRKIVQMFNSKENNPNNAQLIFATHDPNLLNNKLFRRDQIWFAEKNHIEATELYSLVEYKLDDNKKVRKDASYSKDYLNGRYGAIPFLGEFNFSGDKHE